MGKPDYPLSQANKMLLRTLDVNPMASEAELAEIMESSVEALRRRLRRLKARGAVFDVPIVSRSASELRKRAVIGLSVDRQALAAHGKRNYSNYDEFCRYIYRDLIKSPEWRRAVNGGRFDGAAARIDAVYSVQGTVDVILIIAATDADLISELVSDVIDQLKGVRRSVTFTATEGEFFPASNGASLMPVTGMGFAPRLGQASASVNRLEQRKNK